ncbi:MAG: nucleotidyltransferase family protein [Phormidesmis sp.]
MLDYLRYPKFRQAENAAEGRKGMVTQETKTGFHQCKTAIALPEAAIIEFCDRWKIKEFYLFGSVLRDDFHASSDVDIMVQFAPDTRWGFEIVDMKEALETIFERKVDFLTKASIEESRNWMRRKEILGTAKLIYAAG